VDSGCFFGLYFFVDIEYHKKGISATAISSQKAPWAMYGLTH